MDSTKNTLENHMAFRALYIGQNVLGHKGHENQKLDWLELQSRFLIDGSYLGLKNVAEITDIDAIEVAIMFNWYRLKVRYDTDWRITRIDNGNIKCKLSNDHFDLEVMISKSGRVWSNDQSITSNYKIDSAIFDYLRSKEYLIAFRNISQEEILEFGWAKIKGPDS